MGCLLLLLVLVLIFSMGIVFPWWFWVFLAMFVIFKVVKWGFQVAFAFSLA